jgi:hypothetical protein
MLIESLWPKVLGSVTEKMGFELGLSAIPHWSLIRYINNKQQSLITSYTDGGDREGLGKVGCLFGTDVADCPRRFFHKDIT